MVESRSGELYWNLSSFETIKVEPNFIDRDHLEDNKLSEENYYYWLYAELTSYRRVFEGATFCLKLACLMDRPVTQQKTVKVIRSWTARRETPILEVWLMKKWRLNKVVEAVITDSWEHNDIFGCLWMIHLMCNTVPITPSSSWKLKWSSTQPYLAAFFFLKVRTGYVTITGWYLTSTPPEIWTVF